jgi:uncharacterized spore protein YtfJ
MSDETAIVPERVKQGAKLPKEVEKMLAEVGRSTNTDMVFGATRVVGDHVLIPVARVMYGGGGGGGVTEGTDDEPAGHGNGMGLSVVARPIGVIKVTGDKVDWVPTVDVGALATIAAIVAGTMAILFMLGWNRKLTAKAAVPAPALAPAPGIVGIASDAIRLVSKLRSHAAAS